VELRPKSSKEKEISGFLNERCLIPAEINLLISAQIYLQAAIADLENSKLATVISLNIDLLSIVPNPSDEIFSDIVL
jgi:hypothetical protein